MFLSLAWFWRFFARMAIICYKQPKKKKKNVLENSYTFHIRQQPQSKPNKWAIFFGRSARALVRPPDFNLFSSKVIMSGFLYLRFIGWTLRIHVILFNLKRLWPPNHFFYFVDKSWLFFCVGCRKVYRNSYIIAAAAELWLRHSICLFNSWINWSCFLGEKKFGWQYSEGVKNWNMIYFENIATFEIYRVISSIGYVLYRSIHFWFLEINYITIT